MAERHEGCAENTRDFHQVTREETTFLTSHATRHESCEKTQQTYQILETLENLSRVVRNGALIVAERSPSVFEEAGEGTTRHSFHKDLEHSVLAQRSVISHDVLVVETRVQRDFFV